ncbi:hypothetical protein BDAP_000978 [Binucleata daphniae]
MSHYINNSYLLQKKLHFISKKHNKVSVSPYFLHSRTIKILLPHFTSACFCTNVKNIFGIIEARNFEIKNNVLEYKTMYKNIEIVKKIEIDEYLECDVRFVKEGNFKYEKTDIGNVQSYEPDNQFYMTRNFSNFDICISREVAEFLGKIKNIDKVECFCEDGFVKFVYNDNVRIEVKFRCKEMDRFKVRNKDLWFLKYAVEDVKVRIHSNYLLFYLFEDESISIVKVDMVD